MSNNETLANILADIRTFGERCSKRPFSWQMVDGLFKRLADRIEAARARESGNAAAMRAALEAVAENLSIHIQCGRFVAPGDHVSFPASEAEAYIRDIHNALSAPPRNCDRFSFGEEAWIAFERERPDWCDAHSSKDPDCMDCEMADCGRCMAEWLLGPEGGRGMNDETLFTPNEDAETLRSLKEGDK